MDSLQKIITDMRGVAQCIYNGKDFVPASDADAMLINCAYRLEALQADLVEAGRITLADELDEGVPSKDWY